MVIIPSVTQTRMTPLQGHLTLKFLCANRSLLRIESVSRNTTATDIEGGSSRSSIENGTNGANKSRSFVATSILLFKYLTEQISAHLGDIFPFSRQPDLKPILKRARQFLPFKDICSQWQTDRYSGRENYILA